MKRIGFSLIIFGFLAASWVAVQHATEVSWLLFIPIAVASVMGVGFVRRSTKAHAEHADTIAANIRDIEHSLRSVVEKVTQLNRDKGQINTYDMRHKIDDMLLDDLDKFINARETIGVRYGLHAYADIMSHFAAGERYLNRVWSCSADGYIDEVNDFMVRAEEQFVITLQRFQALAESNP